MLNQYNKRFSNPIWILGLILACSALVLLPDNAIAQKKKKKVNYCKETSKAAFKSCRFDATDDFFSMLAICANESSAKDRRECKREARTERKETLEECKEIKEARNDLCKDFGKAPYDPDIDPANFLTPAQTAVNPNQFFPLIPGLKRVYKSGSETVTVIVTDDTREIMGVTTMIVNDVVTENGEVVEDTDDYFAQDKDGNVWYFGEIAKNYEDGYLTDLDGSFIGGVDGDKPGILMKANPQIEDKYRQEFAIREAEDIAEVISLTGNETTPAAACNNACLVTEETTPLEPDVLENKYYVPNVGPILAIDMETGEREELVELTLP